MTPAPSNLQSISLQFERLYDEEKTKQRTTLKPTLIIDTDQATLFLVGKKHTRWELKKRMGLYHTLKAVSHLGMSLSIILANENLNELSLLNDLLQKLTEELQNLPKDILSVQIEFTHIIFEIIEKAKSDRNYLPQRAWQKDLLSLQEPIRKNIQFAADHQKKVLESLTSEIQQILSEHHEPFLSIGVQGPKPPRMNNSIKTFFQERLKPDCFSVTYLENISDPGQAIDILLGIKTDEWLGKLIMHDQSCLKQDITGDGMRKSLS